MAFWMRSVSSLDSSAGARELNCPSKTEVRFASSLAQKGGILGSVTLRVSCANTVEQSAVA